MKNGFETKPHSFLAIEHLSFACHPQENCKRAQKRQKHYQAEGGTNNIKEAFHALHPVIEVLPGFDMMQFGNKGLKKRDDVRLAPLPAMPKRFQFPDK